MKIVKGKTTESTESELMEYYLKEDWDTVYSFREYLDKMVEVGVKIVEENED